MPKESSSAMCKASQGSESLAMLQFDGARRGLNSFGNVSINHDGSETLLNNGLAAALIFTSHSQNCGGLGPLY